MQWIKPDGVPLGAPRQLNNGDVNQDYAAQAMEKLKDKTKDKWTKT